MHQEKDARTISSKQAKEQRIPNQRLRAHRLMRNWTQAYVATRIGATDVDVSRWEYLNQHPEAGKTFDLGMTSFSRIVNGPIAKAYDFSSISTLVDVGGGHGSLLMTILKSYPMMKGILFERPPVIEGAREHIEEGLVWKEVTEVETVA